MRLHIMIIIALLFCLVNHTLAQNENNDANTPLYYGTGKHLGMNMTPLLVKLTPLNRAVAGQGPIDIMYKKRGKKGKRALRVGFGINLDLRNQENGYFNFRLGAERYHKILDKLYFSRGWDFITFVGNDNFNIPIAVDNIFNNAGAGVGFGPVFGLEYFIAPRLSISTESTIFFGIATDAPIAAQVIPPAFVFLNAKF